MKNEKVFWSVCVIVNVIGIIGCLISFILAMKIPSEISSLKKIMGLLFGIGEIALFATLFLFIDKLKKAARD